MAISPASSATQAAFGLDFQSLLNIILTQLTYQDPLKPLDNFQFVSQLGQFAQLQQGQTLSDQVDQLLNNEASGFAVGVLGKAVDLASSAGTLTGTVRSVSLVDGQVSLVVTTADGQTLSGVTLADVSQVR